jgi:hypothetical protein
MRRTTSGHAIVWMSAWIWYQHTATLGSGRASYVGDVEEMGVKVVHVDQAAKAKRKRDDLPDVKR